MSESKAHHHEQPDLFGDFDKQAFQYELLTGHHRTDGSYKTDDQLRSEYIRRTDELIQRITEGVRVNNPETGEWEVRSPDVVVYLDKSARPVSWLVKELWPKLAGEPNEPVPPMPKTRFVNIDREQWVNTVDPQGLGNMDIDLVDQSIIRSLRSIFMTPTHKKGRLGEHIDDAPTELDDKTVLIVDEVFSSGRTLTIAEQFFKRAFPKAAIAGAYWMSGIVQKGMAVGNADLPVWYKEKDPSGRGIDNRDERKSQRSSSMTQRLGSWFLSTTFEHPDPSSNQLRNEINLLAHDPNVLITPSPTRSVEDTIQRATTLNGLTLEEYLERKRKLNEQ